MPDGWSCLYPPPAVGVQLWHEREGTSARRLGMFILPASRGSAWAASSATSAGCLYTPRQRWESVGRVSLYSPPAVRVRGPTLLVLHPAYSAVALVSTFPRCFGAGSGQSPPGAPLRIDGKTHTRCCRGAPLKIKNDGFTMGFAAGCPRCPTKTIVKTMIRVRSGAPRVPP